MAGALEFTRFATDTDLVGWYKFNGNRTDSSSSGNNGTDSGTVNDVTGLFDGAVKSAASGSKITLTENVSLALTSFSVFTWFKSTASHAFEPIFRRSDAFFHGYLLFLNSGTLKSYIGNGSDHELSSAVGVNDGVWHHVGMTYDNSNQRVYVDGVLKNTGAAATIINGGTLKIMRDDLNAVSLDSGTLDDFVIFKRKLSDADVAELYLGSNIKKVDGVAYGQVERYDGVFHFGENGAHGFQQPSIKTVIGIH